LKNNIQSRKNTEKLSKRYEDTKTATQTEKKSGEIKRKDTGQKDQQPKTDHNIWQKEIILVKKGFAANGA
jgi:hypothetical protein